MTRRGASQLAEFRDSLAQRTGASFPDAAALHAFSVAEPEAFWAELVRWSGLLVEGDPAPARTGDECERARFFPNLRLNYAENLLAGDDDQPAVTALHRDRPDDRLTRGELRARVLGLAGHLQAIGINPGDRVAAVAGNHAEVIVAALATTALGATFSSATPDMGADALASRFDPVRPTVLFTDAGGGAPNLIALRDLPSAAPLDQWPRLPFDHPLFVLFTSGTTGPPKCIVHGAGGTLLEHVKEHRLHCDIGPDDTVFFHTTTAWMMWNWQLSALASGAHIVVYDSGPTSPEELWRIVAAQGVTVFGTSPPHLQASQDAGLVPGRELDLERLRSVLSTGSVLHDWQFDWVAEAVGPVALQSISGGTEIIGCFVLGHPELEVRRGRAQCRSLGLDVEAVDGELVCRNPFPSRPLGFIDDADGQRFHDAYFAAHPGMWTHGDVIDFDADGHARLHGRADGVLNARGVRIGPAEIYRAARDVDGIAELMAVEQATPGVRGHTRIVLLVVLRPGATLDDALELRLRTEIAHNASRLHVPELIVAVAALPITHSGKRSERAARDALAGGQPAAAAALANPDVLTPIARAVAEASDRQAALAAAPITGVGADRVVAMCERVLGVRGLGPEDKFFAVGGTSLSAVRLLQLIFDEFGVELPFSTLVHAQTPRALAELVDRPPARRAMVAPLRDGSGRRPLFVVHDLSGDVMAWGPVLQRLVTDRPVYAIRARGLDPLEAPHTDVLEMAGAYVQAIRTVQPSGPYALCGYSFGALVAYEMARDLTARGEAVDLLGLVDGHLHHTALTPAGRRAFRARQPLRYTRAAFADPRTRLPRLARRAVGRATLTEEELAHAELPPRWLHLQDLAWSAYYAYSPGPYAGPAVYFSAVRREPGLCDPLPIWRAAIGGELTVERLPGGHVEIMREPTAATLAAALSARLAALDGDVAAVR